MREKKRTGRPCRAKVAEVIKIEPTDICPLTVHAVHFRKVLQNPLGVDRSDFDSPRDHATAVREAMDARKPSYRLRDWDWKYEFDGVDIDPGSLITTACKCSPVEYQLSVARILSGEITTVGAPLNESDTP